MDDDPVFVFSMKKVMELAEFCENLEVFRNGQEVLFSLQQNHADLPDVIFLDINMPVMDGWELLTELHRGDTSAYRRIYWYILSSSVDNADLLRVNDYSLINGYLIKPLMPEILRQLKTKLLG